MVVLVEATVSSFSLLLVVLEATATLDEEVVQATRLNNLIGLFDDHRPLQEGELQHNFSQSLSFLLGNALVALLLVCGCSCFWSAVSSFSSSLKVFAYSSF